MHKFNTVYHMLWPVPAHPSANLKLRNRVFDKHNPKPRKDYSSMSSEDPGEIPSTLPQKDTNTTSIDHDAMVTQNLLRWSGHCIRMSEQLNCNQVTTTIYHNDKQWRHATESRL